VAAASNLAESLVADDVNDDVERALAAYGGTGLTYRTFGKFSIGPRVPVVTQMTAGPAAAPPALPSPAIPPVLAAAPPPPPAVRPIQGVPAFRMADASPGEVADAEADDPPHGPPIAPARPMARPAVLAGAPPALPVAASGTRQPLRPAHAEPVSRLAGVRARRAGGVPTLSPAHPLPSATLAARPGVWAPPTPAAPEPSGFHMEWGNGADAERERVERPATAPPAPPAMEPSVLPDARELFRRL
jgi:hypothetical protein